MSPFMEKAFLVAVMLAAWAGAAVAIALWWGRTARAGTAHLDRRTTNEREDRP